MKLDKRSTLRRVRHGMKGLSTVLVLAVVSLALLLAAPAKAVTGPPMTSPLKPPLGATPWAILFCKFSDHPGPFDMSPSLITEELAGYWRDVTHVGILLDGSLEFPWATVPFTLAQAQTMTQAQRIDACIAAVDVDLSKYYGVVVAFNAEIGAGHDGRRVVLERSTWYPSIAAHEMGHAYGLDNSFDDSGIVYAPTADGRPGAYGDGWDIMSSMVFGNTDPTFEGRYGKSGPGLNALNLLKVGSVPPEKIFTWDGTSQTTDIQALNTNENIPNPGPPEIIKVPIDPTNPNHYYTVEYRFKSSWDRGIPQQVVLIHELRTDGLSYLIRANGGPEWLSGQTFHDVTHNVAITVVYTSFSIARVNIGRD